ncbi:uncharacterized protein [Parasteatoda tepidariorum]|uniref:uncharacterized protein n=1 Tax=Parasteatoda tepidariorum TaxID=114398 RepID=UPI001C71C24D|nr:uncharacterized protein LOC107437584 [Parasteatoda tepidariorum]
MFSKIISLSLLVLCFITFVSQLVLSDSNDTSERGVSNQTSARKSSNHTSKMKSSNHTSDDDLSTESDEEKIEKFLLCLENHEFAYVDCFRNIGIVTTKDISNMTRDEARDFTCALENSEINCFNLKNNVYCRNDVDPFQNLFREVTPNVTVQCNNTGIVKFQSVQFSI